MMKSLLKVVLCASVLVTGLVFNPIKTYANERASNVSYGYLTRTINNTTVGGNVTVKLRVAYINNGFATVLDYIEGSSVCSAASSGVTCSIVNDSSSGTSSSDSASSLVINFDIKLKKTGSNQTLYYTATVSRNVITSFGKR